MSPLTDLAPYTDATRCSPTHRLERWTKGQLPVLQQPPVELPSSLPQVRDDGCTDLHVCFQISRCLVAGPGAAPVQAPADGPALRGCQAGAEPLRSRCCRDLSHPPCHPHRPLPPDSMTSACSGGKPRSAQRSAWPRRSPWSLPFCFAEDAQAAVLQPALNRGQENSVTLGQH